MSVSRPGALIGKEFRQHGVSLLVLLLLQGMAFCVLLLAAYGDRRSMTLLTVANRFVMIFIPLSAMVLGNRLVVSEYHGRTQLFVESLPVSRWQMLLVKYVLGLVLLLLSASAVLWACAAMARATEPVESRFLAIMFSRMGAFIFFLWGWLFVMGLMGKLRIPIYFGILLGVSVIASMTDVDLLRFGPFAVIDIATFPFERHDFPVSALMQTVALGSSWIAVALVLALIHEGSVAEALSRRMSQKEKALVGILCFGFLLVVLIADEHRSKEPYTFTHRAVLTSEVERLQVFYVRDDMQEDAEALGARLEALLGELKVALDLGRLPPVRVAYRSSLDSDTFEKARLEGVDGVVVRANFRQTDTWAFQPFAAFLTREVLMHTTRERAEFEPKRWLIDGFPVWWTQEYMAETTGVAADHRLMLQALAGTDADGFTPDNIRYWNVFRERYGEPVAEAVACSGFVFLDERCGRDAAIGLARAVLGRRPPESAKETWYEYFHPMLRVFEEATQSEWDAFVCDWSEWLQGLREHDAFKDDLDGIVTACGEVRVEQGEGSLRHVAYGLTFDSLPGESVICSLVHALLTPSDTVIAERNLLREEHLCSGGEAGNEWHLRGEYQEGDLAFFAVEYEPPRLGCPVRAKAVRVVIE